MLAGLLFKSPTRLLSPVERRSRANLTYLTPEPPSQWNEWHPAPPPAPPSFRHCVHVTVMLQIPDSAGDISRGPGFSFEMLGGHGLQRDATFVPLLCLDSLFRFSVSIPGNSFARKAFSHHSDITRTQQHIHPSALSHPLACVPRFDVCAANHSYPCGTRAWRGSDPSQE